MIPEHKIEEILERVDLVSLISRHVELKKSGREYKGRCPFHQEKTPSFYVVPEKRFYFCHGCRASGDAVSFVQRYLGKTFVDAVKDLAREVGVDVEAAQDPGSKERQQIKEVTDLAAEHFRTQLWQDEGRTARQYLANRGVSEETAHAFGLGWAPNTWSLLADKLTKNGMTDWGVKAGLVQRRNNSDGYYDFFRSRVMVPIRAPEGRPIAFGGRLLGAEEGPKYLNSKESRLYNKSETLYGMDQARDEIRRRKAAILVEGYFDCIGLHQVGVRHAVALCSTAITPGHLQLLRRTEAQQLILLLDGDQAGLNAVERLAGPLLAAGAAARVALLPQGDDPDTFARREGSDGVDRLLQDAQPLTSHIFATVLPNGAKASFEEKMAALERLKPMTALIPLGLVRSAFLNAVGGHFGLPVGDLEAALRPTKPAPKPAQPPAPQGASGAQRPTTADRPVSVRPPDAMEALYVAATLREPRLLARDPYRACDEISHTSLRVVLAQATSGNGTEDALFEAAEPVKRALEVAMRQLPEGGAALEQAFLAVCRTLTLRRVEEQLRYIEKATKQTPGASELTEETKRLLQERIALVALQKRIKEELRPSVPGTKAPLQPV
ncbi:DNA primase [Hyalangium versicolor]|uniref:DNA primase n=1 Tax=Hyalangium versicolor TaxID=2861190 RepID=UPI001CCC75CB|nr:DNA primase [Hyalangium versicolor]